MKKYICCKCGKSNKKIGVIQKETHYYSLDLETRQLEDFHGDSSTDSQEFFCLNCNAKIKNDTLEI